MEFISLNTKIHTPCKFGAWVTLAHSLDGKLKGLPSDFIWCVPHGLIFGRAPSYMGMSTSKSILQEKQPVNLSSFYNWEATSL